MACFCEAGVPRAAKFTVGEHTYVWQCAVECARAKGAHSLEDNVLNNVLEWYCWQCGRAVRASVVGLVRGGGGGLIHEYQGDTQKWYVARSTWVCMYKLTE